MEGAGVAPDISAADNGAVVVATHDPDVAEFCDETTTLHDGKTVSPA